MRKILTPAFFFLFVSGLHAQKDSVEKVFAFPITDYISRVSDTLTVVQVVQPGAWPVFIKDRQMGLVQHVFRAGEDLDTAAIGWGRCQLIKGQYYYFGIHLYRNQDLKGGDLLYAKIKVPVQYSGLLLDVMKHDINLTTVDDRPFLMWSDLFTNNKQKETAILDSMVADLHYTASVMQQQMPGQNLSIIGGIYNGNKLFPAMLKATRAELELFLKYIVARPRKYAGNTWKISEIFATWMVSETPTVIEK